MKVAKNNKTKRMHEAVSNFIPGGHWNLTTKDNLSLQNLSPQNPELPLKAQSSFPLLLGSPVKKFV
jgi:hypothetical protein